MTPADLRNQFQKETGESPNIATYTYWLEQRLLSSEAEKGEDELAVVEKHICQYCGMETIFPDSTCYKAPIIPTKPSPSSPQEKQGVECEHYWVDFSFSKFRCIHCGEFLNKEKPLTASPAAPDKGEEINQCDGCQAGIPVDEHGNHKMGQGGYPDYMACQKQKYKQ